MRPYQHTQIGTLLIVVMGAVVAICAVFTWMIPAARIPLLLTIAILVIAGILFLSLTVRVDHECIECSFGPGLIRRRIPLSAVRDVQPVRNAWWYGWGIRITPHGWLWNVSGLDAVELTFNDGRRFRIGTDEPAQLVEAICAHRMEAEG